MANIAGVQNKFGRRRQRVDFGDRNFQSCNHVGVRGLVESHVTVADPDETEFAPGSLCDVCAVVEAVGLQYSAFNDAQGAGAGQAMPLRNPRRAIPSWWWSNEAES